jgi:tetratricopeptide (TPR) repeat protein
MELGEHVTALASLLQKAGELESRGQLWDAIATYDKALELEPENARVYFRKANTWRQLEQLAPAITCFNRSIELNPDNANAYCNRGNALKDSGRIEEAIADYERALQLLPTLSVAHGNLGIAKLDLGDTHAAIECFNRAIELDPKAVGAINNRGLAWLRLGQFEAAGADYERALAIDPQYPNARWSRALLQLLRGDFEHGWAEYEWRWKNPRIDTYKVAGRFSEPRWLNDQPVHGKTLLIYAEQGLGDTLQFCRYLSRVGTLGARVIFEVPRSLHRLLGNIEGPNEVIAKGDPLPAFDLQCPLLSLPLAFNTRLETIPGGTPYLHSDPASLDKWRARLGERTAPRVGIVWSGRASYVNDARRSATLAQFEPLFQLPLTYVSLQKEVREVDRDYLDSHPEILDFSDELEDFTDTTALCELMDLVISVDTSVAHLAGALAKPVWILLPSVPDWRWLLDREDSPWYPSARLFRQRVGELWAPVIERLRDALGTHFKREFAASANLPVARVPRTVASAPVRMKACIEKLSAEGFAAYATGDLARAEDLFEQIRALQPTHFDALHLLGVIAARNSQPERAVPLFQAAINVKPDSPQAHANMGNALSAMNQFEAALAAYDRGIALEPAAPQGYFNKGLALYSLGRYEESAASHAKAIELQPGFAGAHHHRGRALRELDRNEEAIQCYNHAIELAPGDARAQHDRAFSLYESGRFAAALEGYNRAIDINPQYPIARWNRAVLQLLLGQYNPGWQEYEWRLRNDRLLPRELWRDFREPRWRGEADLKDKTLLVWAEQGLGDTLQFCRYVPLLLERGARVVLEVPAALVSLLSSLSDSVRVIAAGETLPAFDLQCPLLSLPWAFATTAASIPSQVPYLRAPTNVVEKWRHRLGPRAKPRIGLVWSGSGKILRDQRSAGLARFRPLLDLDCDFVCLQKEISEADREALSSLPRLREFSGGIQDFSDTAALCELMDQVITIDTSIAHLAGALGKPMWVLLPWLPDWRWLLDREDSPWYPSARLYRPEHPGDWDGVMARVHASLVKLRDNDNQRQADLARLMLEGISAHQGKRDVRAKLCFERVLQIDPQHARALHMLGVTLARHGQYPRAIALFEQALQNDPENADIHYHRALAFQKLEEPWRAIAGYRAAIKLRPDFSDAHTNLALLLLNQCQFAAARTACERAIEANPADVNARWNHAVILLLLGELGRGWVEYEWRWKIPRLNPRANPRRFDTPQWLGQFSIEGKTILVHAEQGLGDTLQFCRYASAIRKRGARVILEVQPSLRELLSSLTDVDEVISQGDPIPSHDCHCPILSLPLALGTTLATIPADVPYLHASPVSRDKWRALLGPRHRPRIGIAWSGNRRQANDAVRSMSLATLLPLLALDADIISLQKEIRDTDAVVLRDHPSIRTFDGDIVDFSDTAALCEAMDLIISVDTSVAHLAGALGKPVWIMLLLVPDWRWLLYREDSPWYPSARLFRQTRAHDWSGVIARVMVQAGEMFGCPVDAQSYRLDGVTLFAQGRIEEAIHRLRQSLAGQPDLALTHNHLGVALSDLHRFDEAIASYNRAIELDPTFAEAYTNRGVVQFLQGRYDDAAVSYERAIEIDPNHANAHWNRSVFLLLRGDYERGWPEYEWRLRNERTLPAWRQRDFRQPRWHGEPLRGRTLLVHAEQGLGDTLQFCRYLPLLLSRGAHLVFEAPPPLASLVANMDTRIQVVARGESLPPFDVHVPLLSLPMEFNTSLQTIPREVPYLHANEAVRAKWQALLGPGNSPRIGLVWRGSGRLAHDERSGRLSEFLSLLMPGMEFYCLQKDISESERALLASHPAIRIFDDQVADFSDTAALCEMMDLVITIDTSVAHLAGALGKPLRVLLSPIPDWRWLLDREDSPWYPTATLFRQSEPGNWASVINRVKRELIQRFNIVAPPSDNPSQLVAEGILANLQGRFIKAQGLLKRALSIDHNKPHAWHILGTIYARSGNHRLALEHFEKALALAPRIAEFNYHKALAHQVLGEWDRAIESYDATLHIQPDHANAHGNLAIALANRQRFDEALDHYNRAIQFDPQNIDAHWNRSVLLLLLGDLKRGFAEYEWRWRVPRLSINQSPRNFDSRLWLGEAPLKGKSILLHAEQGQGDTLQFCRYVNAIHALGASVVLEVQSSLKTLLASLPNAMRVLARGEALPVTDFHCPLLSLPHALNTTLENIPADIPYLAASADSIQRWRTRLGPARKPRIGLVWSGNARQANDVNRSLGLSAFAPLLAINAEFICLQKEVRPTDQLFLRSHAAIREVSGEIEDFSDTAALCELMDLVISIDTSVAHLAGALGKPVWILLPAVPDWRWLLNREDSPWYPTARLFRQIEPGGWSEVIRALRDALQQFCVHHQHPR